MVKRLRYGNTNTFFIKESGRGLLVDTDYAGTLPMFFRCIKQADIGIKDIGYLLATHYHPDHMGIAGELQKLGVKLLLIDIQKPYVHFSDRIFEREKRFGYKAPDETAALTISCEESRAFLLGIGIKGEIMHTPGHSVDSVSLVLDEGSCMVGDLEPFEFLEGYKDKPELRDSWEKIMSRKPKRILFAHANEKDLQ